MTRPETETPISWQFANVDGQVACGFLLGQAQNFFRGSWQQSGGSGIPCRKRTGERDRREQQHRALELQRQLRRGPQSLFVFVDAIQGTRMWRNG